MQVIFIHHSCFLVEVDEKVLIFDWFDGDRVEGITLAVCCRSMSRIRPSTCSQATSIGIILIWMCCISQKNIRRSGLFFQKTVR